MDNAVLIEIDSLRRASLAVLREKYRIVFEEETRSRHRQHLFRRIAWRLQALDDEQLAELIHGAFRFVSAKKTTSGRAKSPAKHRG